MWLFVLNITKLSQQLTSLILDSKFFWFYFFKFFEDLHGHHMDTGICIKRAIMKIAHFVKRCLSVIWKI